MNDSHWRRYRSRQHLAGGWLRSTSTTASLRQPRRRGLRHRQCAGFEPIRGGPGREAGGGRFGVDVAIDALGGSRTMLGGLFSLRKGGRLTQVGLTSTEDQGNVSIPLDLFVLQELAIIGSNGNPHSAYPHLLTLVAAGKLNPRALVSKVVSLTRDSGSDHCFYAAFSRGWRVTSKPSLVSWLTRHLALKSVDRRSK
jgi:hypothetical protein